MGMTESDIVKGCLANNAKAQRALYDKYAAAMLSICLRYTGSMQTAEDVLQEGFLKVYSKMNQYKGQNQLAGWIKTIMVNTSLIHLRKEKKHDRMEDVNEHFELSDDQLTAVQRLEHEDLLRLVADLPTGYRTVFNLFAIEGFGHKEIAEKLGVTESTSKTQFRKAKAWLQQKLLEAATKENKLYEQSKT